MDWRSISARVSDGGKITPKEALSLLESPNSELLDILQASYQLRYKHFSNKVSLHLLRNVKVEFALKIVHFALNQLKL